MEIVNLENKFDKFDDYWSPKIVAELNDSYVLTSQTQRRLCLAHT